VRKSSCIGRGGLEGQDEFAKLNLAIAKLLKCKNCQNITSGSIEKYEIDVKAGFQCNGPIKQESDP
jgi:hypothetical protein